MVDIWSGNDYGYDEIGITDPFYDMTGNRFSFDISEIVNLNTPINKHIHKMPYERNAINSKCQELLINLRNKEDEIHVLKSELKKIKIEREKKELANKKIIKTEAFLPRFGRSSGFFGEDNSNLTILIIFVSVVFLVLQLQLQEISSLVHELSHQTIQKR